MSKLIKAASLLLVTACFAAPALADGTPTPAAGTAVAAAPATAAAPAPATAVAAAAPKSSTPKLVCEDDSEIGSHLHKRICLTPEQVQARKKAARDFSDNMHSSVQCGANGCSGGGSSGPPK